MRTKNLFRGVLITALYVLTYINVCGQEELLPDRPEQSQVLNLDLKKAIEIAISTNPTIKIADMEIEKADYARKEVIGSLFPNIGASASYQRTIEKQVMAGLDPGAFTSGIADMLTPIYEALAEMGHPVMPPAQEEGSSEPMKIGMDNAWSAGFSAGMPLINVPLWQSIKLTAEAVNSKVEAARASKIDMVAAVTEAFYGILNAQDSYNVLLKSFETANENLRIAKTRYEQGMASEYDMIQAEVQVKNMQPALLSVQNGIELAKLQLKVLMGVPSILPVSVVGTLADYERDMFEIVNISDVDTTLADNPTIRQLEVSAKLLERQLKLQKAQWYPTLSLSFVYQWISNNNDFKFSEYQIFPYSMAGVTLSFPIFQGGARYYKQKQARIAYDEMAYTMENVRQQLGMQLQASIDQIRLSVEQIGSTLDAVALAEKGVTISQKRYEVGAGSSLELISSENALTQARLNHYQSIYNYIVAKNALDKVLGNAYNEYVR
ncbi:MAG: TolC family protein [Prevotellaceae bacterium]|jgi:outer membrane protein TolC|nr:TolC family protein [Prevotellaceae bacterium]